MWPGDVLSTNRGAERMCLAPFWKDPLHSRTTKMPFLSRPSQGHTALRPTCQHFETRITKIVSLQTVEWQDKETDFIQKCLGGLSDWCSPAGRLNVNPILGTTRDNWKDRYFQWPSIAWLLCLKTITQTPFRMAEIEVELVIIFTGSIGGLTHWLC